MVTPAAECDVAIAGMTVVREPASPSILHASGVPRSTRNQASSIILSAQKPHRSPRIVGKVCSASGPSISGTRILSFGRPRRDIRPTDRVRGPSTVIESATAATYLPEALMLVRLALVWLSVIVPYTLAGAIGGPTGLLPHVVFHPIYIAFLLATIVLLIRLRGATRHRGIRVLSVVAAVASAIAIAGQIGEEITVVANGGMHAPDSMLEQSDHLTWAIISVLGGLFPSLLALAALSIVAGITLLRGKDWRGWAALAPGVLYIADFVLSIAGLRVSQLSIPTFGGVIVLAAVAWATRAVPTSLDAGTQALPAPSDSVILAP